MKKKGCGSIGCGGLIGLFVLFIVAWVFIRPAETKVEIESPKTEEEHAAYSAGYTAGHIVGNADRRQGRPREGIRAYDLGKMHGKADYPEHADSYADGYHLGYNEGWHGE